jgi:general secretion pathway protein G
MVTLHVWPALRRIRGFTMIEVLVVLALIGLLITITAPTYINRVEQGREIVLSQNLNAIRTAIDRFHADTGRYPATLLELVERQYMRTVPVDPITQTNDTWQMIPPSLVDLPSSGRAQADASGVADVRSGAEGVSRQGVPYAQL